MATPNELTLRIILTKKQLEFQAAIEKYPVVLFGGGRGGGKSYGLRNIMLKRRFQYPKSIGYLFRKTYPELERNHISPLFAQFPALRPFYNDGKKNLKLPNGSELRFAFCEHRKDLGKFQGAEMHDLGIEEAGDWEEHFFEMLRASNRSSIPGIEPRAILTANPAGLGHKWLKRLFIDKKYTPEENPKDYHFVPSLVEDNPALMKADPLYVRKLESIKSTVLRKAWRGGDWNVTAGQFFNEFARDIHVVKPFKIPLHWKWFGAYDYGFNHPAVWGWFVTDEDGNVYMVKELARAQMHLDAQAAAVGEIEEQFIVDKEKLTRSITFWAGHDCWATKKAGDPTIAEDFMNPRVVEKNIIHLKQANIQRKLGAAQLRQYLRYEIRDEKRWGPRLFIFNTCEATIDCLPRMVHNPEDIEDVLKVDASEGDIFTGDDPYDMLRYGIMSRPILAVAAQKSSGTTYNDERKIKRPSWRTV